MSGVALQRAADLDARDVGQHEVEQHQIGALLGDRGQRVAAAADDDRDVARLPEVVGQDLLQVLLVFDDQNAGHDRFGRVLPLPHRA